VCVFKDGICTDRGSVKCTHLVVKVHTVNIPLILIVLFVCVFKDGTCTDAGSVKCTHLVVNEHNVKSLPVAVHDRVYVVKSEVLLL